LFLIQSARYSVEEAFKMFSRLLIATSILASCCLVGSASTIPNDPDIVLDAGGDASPLTTGTNFIPDANGGGTFDYFNPYAFPITALTFEVTLVQGLPQSTISSDFNCSSGFFQTCSFNYDSPSGVLDIDFFTALNNPTGTGVGQERGIPPLCTTNSNVQCGITGFFEITIDGWSNTASPGLFNGTPTFDVIGVSVAPEPSSGILFGSVLLLAFLFRRAGVTAYRRISR
jgi:hypothetical protein